MEVWVLTMWSLTVRPFTAGEYMTRERCIAAAPGQIRLAKKEYGPLWWSCDRAMDMIGLDHFRDDLKEK